MLISKEEISNYRDISRGVKDDKINPFIDDAQFQDLRPLLGERLYYDLVKNSEDQKYVELLDGGEYEYNGFTYNNPGLKKVLAIYTYARYVLFGSFTDTAFGFVQKTTQDSQAVGDSQKRNIHTQERNTAFNYWIEVAAFLNRNSETYTYWSSNSCKKRKGIKISKIS